MGRVFLYYGKVYFVESEEEAGIPLREVVDDLLGLRDDRGYLFYVDARYGPLLENVVEPVPESLKALEPLRRYVQRQLEAGAPQELLDAVRDAERGVLSAQLANDLAEVQRIDDREAEVPHWRALAAWVIQLLLQDGPLLVGECVLCGQAWLPRNVTVLCCRRPAPGRTDTCRDICNQTSYLERNPDYVRERRRVYRRVRRGVVPQTAYGKWLRENRPGEQGKDWTPFEE